jgi:acyl dehydratase
MMTAAWRVSEVDAQRMKVLALLLADPNPIHFDAAAASRAGIADVPVNQGPSTMALVYNLFERTHSGRRVQRLNVRLLGNVVAGQAVTVTATAGEDGAFAIEVVTDDGTPVLRGRAELAEESS